MQRGTIRAAQRFTDRGDGPDIRRVVGELGVNNKHSRAQVIKAA